MICVSIAAASSISPKASEGSIMEEQDKKKSRKMPSAPIKAPRWNLPKIGKQGPALGGLVPLVVAPSRGGKGSNGTAAQIGRGWISNLSSRKGGKGRG